MKAARLFAAIFAVIAIVLMLGTAVVCFASLDSPVKILKNPTGAVTCSEELMQAVNRGDFSAVEQLLYGQPELGGEGTPEGTYSAMVWDAYLDSISFEYTSRLYLLDADLARDAKVTVLDVAGLTQHISDRARLLLEAKVAGASDMAELYYDSGAFRPELIRQVMQEAVQSALREDSERITRNVTVRLIYRDNRWQAVPDQTFLKTLSGLGA